MHLFLMNNVNIADEFHFSEFHEVMKVMCLFES